MPAGGRDKVRATINGRSSAKLSVPSESAQVATPPPPSPTAGVTGPSTGSTRLRAFPDSARKARPSCSESAHTVIRVGSPLPTTCTRLTSADAAKPAPRQAITRQTKRKIVIRIACIPDSKVFPTRPIINPALTTGYVLHSLSALFGLFLTVKIGQYHPVAANQAYQASFPTSRQRSRLHRKGKRAPRSGKQRRCTRVQ